MCFSLSLLEQACSSCFQVSSLYTFKKNQGSCVLVCTEEATEKIEVCVYGYNLLSLHSDWSAAHSVPASLELRVGGMSVLVLSFLARH